MEQDKNKDYEEHKINEAPEFSNHDDTDELTVKITNKDVEKLRKENEIKRQNVFFRENREDFISLLNERQGGKILEIIQDNKIRPLYECGEAIIDFVRLNQYKQNHIWALKFLENLISKYALILILMLNSRDGIDMLNQAFQKNSGIVKNILALCIQRSHDAPEQKEIEEEFALNLKAFNKNLTDEGIEFDDLEEEFARQFFEYEKHRRVFQEVPIKLEDIQCYYCVNKRLEEVPFNKPKTEFLKKKRRQVDIIYQQTIRSEEENLRRSIFPYDRDLNMLQPLPSLEKFLQGRFIINSGVEESVERPQLYEKDFEQIGLYAAVDLYQKLIYDKTIYKICETNQAAYLADQKLIKLWFGVRASREKNPTEINGILIKEIYKMLPKTEDMSLDMRFKVNTEFANHLKEISERMKK